MRLKQPPPPRPLCSLLSASRSRRRIASPSVAVSADSEGSGGASSCGAILSRNRTAHQRAAGYSAPEEGEDSCHQVRSLTARRRRQRGGRRWPRHLFRGTVHPTAVSLVHTLSTGCGGLSTSDHWIRWSSTPFSGSS